MSNRCSISVPTSSWSSWSWPRWCSDPAGCSDAARSLARARNELRRLTSGLDPGTQKLLRDPGAAVVEALAEPFHADDRPGGPG